MTPVRKLATIVPNPRSICNADKCILQIRDYSIRSLLIFRRNVVPNVVDVFFR